MLWQSISVPCEAIHAHRKQRTIFQICARPVRKYVKTHALVKYEVHPSRHERPPDADADLLFCIHPHGFNFHDVTKRDSTSEVNTRIFYVSSKRPRQGPESSALGYGEKPEQNSHANLHLSHRVQLKPAAHTESPSCPYCVGCHFSSS